jgi:arylsulfatase A-like enzyme
VPFGGVADGLTQWEVTLAESLSAVGYATALFGKWHLGSQDGRLPNDQGFDEWYGIPRTTDEAMWPSSPGYSPSIMPPEQIMEGRKGERSRGVRVYDTIVIFASDNGPEFIKPWDVWAGPWRGQYFTALEGGIRVPCLIRWPGKVPAARVSDEIVHCADLFPTLASIVGAGVPNDRPIDGVDQSLLWLGRSDKSGREGILIWCADRLQAVKWRHYKMHLYKQDTMVAPPLKLGVPLLFDLYTNPREDDDKPTVDSWVVGPMLKMIGAFEESLKKHPLIAMGTADPYTPPK